MRINFLSILLFVVASSLSAQIEYIEGYFIDNDNRKTDCYIKNVDWKNNPDDFLFKKEESGTPEKGNITFVKEFGIYGYSRYIRAYVKIDRSGSELNSLNYENQPIWIEEQLFLKVLISGKASLYYYEDGNLRRFFYSVTDASINQLVYKKYFVDHGNIATNNKYLQQLWIDLKCPDTNDKPIEKISYTQKGLNEYFIKYNQCSGDTFADYTSRLKSNYFHLKIFPGMNIASVSLDNPRYPNSSFDFNVNTSFRLGIGSEYILPFNRNKWGVVIEPTFQYFNGEVKNSAKTASIKYNSLDFPIGIRYYFFLNKKCKLLLNGFYISSFSLNFNSKINVSPETVLEITNKNSFAVGGGFEYRRTSLEIRYYTKREILNDYISWSSKYQRFSIIFGFKII